MDDIYDFVWKKTISGARLNMYDRNPANYLVEKLLKEGGNAETKKSSPFSFKDLNEVEKQLLTDNVDWTKAAFLNSTRSKVWIWLRIRLFIRR